MDTNSNTPYLSRGELCRAYKLRDATVRDLENRQLISLSWQPKRGILKTQVPDSVSEVLFLAKNHPESFSVSTKVAINRVPFIRFLLIRFIQLPLPDIQVELRDKNLISSQFSMDEVCVLYNQFITNLPDEVAAVIGSLDSVEPGSVVDKQIETLVDILGVRYFWDNPEVEENFAFMSIPEIKYGIDAFLATSDTFDNVRDSLEVVFDTSVDNEMLLLYKTLFSDWAILSPEEAKAYLDTLRPTFRSIIKAGLGASAVELKSRLGMIDDIPREELIRSVKKKLVADVISSLGMPGEEGRSQFERAFRPLMSLMDRDDVISRTTEATSTPSVFEQFKLKSSDIADHGIFRLSALKPDTQDKE